MKRIKPGPTFVGSRWHALLGVFGLSLLYVCAASAAPLVTGSLKSLILPLDDVPLWVEPLPAHLQPPVSVGVALTPPSNPVGTVYYKDQVDLLQAVANKMNKSRYVNRTEIIPNHYVKHCQQFSCFSAIEQQFNVQVIALVSYDQIQFSAHDNGPRLWDLLTGKHLVEGRPGEIHTRVNTSVFSALDQHLLLSASGYQVTRTLSGRPPELNEQALKLKRAQRKMIKALWRSLKQTPSTAKVATEEHHTDDSESASTVTPTATPTISPTISPSASNPSRLNQSISAQVTARVATATTSNSANPDKALTKGSAPVEKSHQQASARAPSSAAPVAATADTLKATETPLESPESPETLESSETPESSETLESPVPLVPPETLESPEASPTNPSSSKKPESSSDHSEKQHGNGRVNAHFVLLLLVSYGWHYRRQKRAKTTIYLSESQYKKD